MQPQTPSGDQPSIFTRIWRSIRREPLWPSDDRGRMRLSVNDLILHLHPPRVPARSIRFSYTFGLGGLAILLFLIMIASGVLLMFAYTPSPEEAHASIIALETQVWFGQLIRNIHHWSGNLMLVVVFLHLLRVFYTAAFRPPREFNWQLGLALLGLVAFANFTGYLLPWDQLSYWAVTVMSGLIKFVPIVGPAAAQLLLGGAEVGETTLRNFYALHVILIPLGVFLIGSFHIWRVRKDKITVPRDLPGESPDGREPLKMVTTIPHLVSIEAVFALVVMALLLAWAALVDAPLLAAANPTHPPNPAKAAWYFLGVQELLLHFHPSYGAVAVPLITISGLVALPYLRDDEDTTGIWFRSRQGRRLAWWSAGTGIVVTVLLVLLSEYVLLPSTSEISNGLLKLLVLMAGVFFYVRLLRRRGATRGEARLALFTLLLAAFLTLTVIGNLFRGPDWLLMWPWEVFAA